MVPIKTILHPTDFSEPSDIAFRLACSLARDHGGRVVVLHVIPSAGVVHGERVLPPRAFEHEELRDKLYAVKPPAPRVPVEYQLAEGDPVAEIVGVAREVPCDLIVMGTHGRTGLSRFIMGSVAEGVVRKAPCPVLTAKHPVPEEEPAVVGASKDAPEVKTQGPLNP
jgi:nucleotide-binding universal stress UspA family protein